MPLHNQALKGRLGQIDNLIVKIIKYISYASMVCLIGIMLVTFFNVLGEKIFHKGIPGSTEIVEYLHVPVVFLSVGFVTLDRGHTSIDLLSQHFPPAVQKAASVFCFLLGTFISTFVGCRGLVQMGKHVSVHARSSVTGFGFPLWPFSLLFSIGFFMIALTFLWSIVRLFAPKEETAPMNEDDRKGGPAQ